MPWWTWVWPLLAWAVLAAKAVAGSNAVLLAAAGICLLGAVFAAVYHAELIAHRIGEPFGTLVLALAVTVIEVALIVSVMLGGGPDAPTLARDTVFAAVMIICNGLVGLCLLVGGIRHYAQGFQAHGATAALAVLAALMVLCLVLPNFTTTTRGPEFSGPQLLFAGTVSLVLYGTFLFVQTVRHPGDFLPDEGTENVGVHHGPTPTARAALVSFGLLVVCLVGVVLLAKTLTPAVNAAVASMGAPQAVVGIVIAVVVLLPEGLAAVRAAGQNRLQTSLNLALGSALACIGLTIPAVAAVSLVLHVPLALGLDGKEEVLLALTLLVGVVTLGTGRTTLMQGAVHLVIVASYLFLSFVP
jgi:Ca2+:H+ antiporter